MGTDSNDLHTNEGMAPVASALDAAALVEIEGEEEAAEPEPELIEADLAGFMLAEPPPVAYALRPLIPVGHVTLLGAHGGAGKSVLALTIAAHVAAGARWCGLDAEHGPAVFVSLEDPAAMVRYRLRRIVPAYGLNPAAIAANLRVLDGADCDAALMREVSEYGTRRLVETAAMKALRERVTDARLIVVDNASDAFDGNENERRAVRRFVRMLAQHARSAGAGVLLLAHIDKVAARYGGAGNSYSGSTAWHNSARSRLALVAESNRVELRHEKHNLGPMHAPIVLHWADGVLMPTGESAGAAEALAASLIADADADAVYSALCAAHAQGHPVGASHTGAGNAHATLKTFGLPDLLADGASARRRFWRAMDALLADGRAKVETVRTDDYKERRRIVIRQSASSANPPYPLETTGGKAAGSSYPPVPQLADKRRIGGCPHCAGEGCDWCKRKDAA